MTTILGRLSDQSDVRACGPANRMIKARTLSLMKLPVLSTICLVVSASVVLAQDPAPATTTPPGATPTTGTPGEKPKPLTSSDKSFLKKALDGMYFEMSLTDKHKSESAKLESTKRVTAKMNTDLQKIWGELAGMFDPKEIPNELAGGDKSKAQRLAKAGDKYDKELLEVLGKESKALERTFESASKSAQHPTIKQVTSTWLPTIKGHNDEIEKAAKEAKDQK